MPTILVFLIYAAAVIGIAAFMVIFSHFLGERHKGMHRDEPFESGMPVTGHARVRYPSHFYMIAMFFVIFDLDAAFIITYAVAFREVGWMGYIGVAIFILLLLVVIVYETRTGALNFGPQAKKILKAMPENIITRKSLE
ncbi:MAG: NADH-quinone oxidoreductase subunit A [Bacteroidales bacterium]